MKLTIHEIERTLHHKPFTFDHKVDVSELASRKNDIRKIEQAQVQGECLVEGEEYIFTLNISGAMILPCARTLVDVSYSYDIDCIEIFSTSQYLTEEELEEEIHPVEGHVIDLRPYILENILLNKPYRVFSEDAAAKMKIEGEGWEVLQEEELAKNEAEVEGTDEKIDPRMEKLKALLDDNHKDQS